MNSKQYHGISFTHSQWIEGADGKLTLRQMTSHHSVLASSAQQAKNIILATHTFVTFKESK